MVILHPTGLSFVIFCICSVYSYLEPTRKCIPTAIIRGPCHSCVCSSAGIFQCRAEECSKKQLPSNQTMNEVCEPHYMYREDKLFCTCTEKGKWKSANCKKNFQYLLPQSDSANEVTKINTKCLANALYLIDCNICQCSEDGYIKTSLCTSRTCRKGHKADACQLGDYLRIENEICVCSAIHYYIDRRCLKIEQKEIQKINLKEIDNLVDFKLDTSCTLHSVYYKDCNRCLCNQDGKLVCSENTCNLPQRSLSKKNTIRYLEKFQDSDDYLYLPELENDQEKCNPGQNYKLKCNTCYCNTNGLPTCTSMLCLDDLDHGQAYGSAPNPVQETRDEDIPTLVEGDDCTPGKVYRVQCNTCTCGYNNELMCTKVACVGEQDYMLRAQKRKRKQKLMKGGSAFPTLPKTKCVPGKIYQKGCQRCFCNERKIAMCTNKPCDLMSHSVQTPEDVRPAIPDGSFDELPALPNQASKCDAGNTYRVDCNSCLCLANGNMLCGKLLCLDLYEINRVQAMKRSGKPCKKGDTLLKEDCMKCTCKNDVMKCVQIIGCMPVSLRKQLHGDPSKVASRLTLDMHAAHCLPNMIYKLSCNNCYCQSDESLRCTKKGCLTYTLAQTLKKQKMKLLKSENNNDSPSED